MGKKGNPNKVAMDKSGANKAAIEAINPSRDVPILVRQMKYLNNIIEQDHRAIKRVTKPMLNFKSFRAGSSVLAGLGLIHMIREGQFAIGGADAMSFAHQFSALAGIPVQFERCSVVLGNSRPLIDNATAPLCSSCMVNISTTKEATRLRREQSRDVG